MKKKKKLSKVTLVKLASRNRIGKVRPSTRVADKRRKLLEKAERSDE